MLKLDEKMPMDILKTSNQIVKGFAKKDDLQFILELVEIDYEHDISVAPDKLLWDDYKKKAIVGLACFTAVLLKIVPMDCKKFLEWTSIWRNMELWTEY